MTTLITGGSKCGKSHYAEALLDGFCGRKIYIATMRPYGEEALAAIARHRSIRSEKGFETMEIYTDAGNAEIPENSAVLLECMGNLLANEMFSENGFSDPTEKIINDIERLAKKAEQLVVVTNQVGNDGISYDEGTSAYIAALGMINSRLSERFDNVYECVFGIPVRLKGAEIC